ncbi:hypothetical protein KNE206_14890 [Kitasatospora sp. NE20-6]|uniref:hypothetical protein n=1 Tax=Kitasatospora sp. NE20-6 TaxID=2859066 RepID=UPI0034DCAD5F
MEIEDGLGRLLADGVSGLRPPVGEMVREAGRIGRRRRRVRRLVTGGAAVLAVAVVAAGSAVWPDRWGAPRSVAAGPPSVATVSGGPSGSPAAADPPRVDATWPAVLQVLSDLLPPGGRFVELDPYATYAANVDRAAGVVVGYERNSAPVSLSVRMLRNVDPAVVARACAAFGEEEQRRKDWGPRGAGVEGAGCRTRLLADGSTLLSGVTHTTVGGFFEDVVRLYRPNGELVELRAGNGVVGDAVVPRPPFGPVWWEEAVQRPEWAFRVPPSTAAAGDRLAVTVSRQPCPDTAPASSCVQ